MKWESISTTPSDMQYKPLCHYQMKIWVPRIILILRAKQVLCVTPKKCVWNSLKNAWISSWGKKNYVHYGNICFPHLGILWKYEILQKYYLQRGNICFLQFATHDWSNSIILLLLKSFSTRFTRRTTEEKGNLHFSLAADVGSSNLSFCGISNKCTLTFCATCM